MSWTPPPPETSTTTIVRGRTLPTNISHRRSGLRSLLFPFPSGSTTAASTSSIMRRRPWGGLGLALLRLLSSSASAAAAAGSCHRPTGPRPGFLGPCSSSSRSGLSLRHASTQRRRVGRSVRMEAVAPPKPVEAPPPPQPTPVTGSYGADKITVLEGLEPVRKR